MSMDVRKVKLDFNKTFQSDIPSVQGDTGRSIEFQIMNGSLAEDITGETVKIFGLKPDGFRVFNNATITDAPNGKCVVELTQQMLCVAGTVQCTLVRYKNGLRFSSKKFNITVSDTVADDIEIESTSEYLALTDALSITAENINTSVNSVIDEMLSNGDLANMTIANNSIDSAKYKDNSVTPGKTSFLEKQVGKNLFNVKTQTANKKLNAIGTVEDDSTYSISDYIEVKTGTYAFSYSTDNGYLCIATYDRDKVIMRKLAVQKYGANVTTINIADGECFVRLNYNEKLKNTVQFEKGSTKTSYTAYIDPSYTLDAGLIPNNGVGVKHLDEDLKNTMKKVNNVDQMMKTTTLTLLFNPAINSIDFSKVWSSGDCTPVITKTEAGTNVVLDNSTNSTRYVYQHSKSNNATGTKYIVIKYTVNEATGAMFRVVNADANRNLSVTVGEHTEFLKSTSSGTNFIKPELTVEAGGKIDITITKIAYLSYDLGGLSEDFIFECLDKVEQGLLEYTDVSVKIGLNSYENNTIPYDALSDDAKSKLVTKESKWKNKVWVSYGDSITAQSGWQDYVIKELGLAHTNKGIGGTTACGTDDKAGASDARINSFPSNVDLVTIMFGTNDWSQNKPLGVLELNSDTQASDYGYDVNTFYGALCTIVKKIQTKYPMARIILMCPPFRTNSQWGVEPVLETLQNGLSIRDFGDVVKKVGRKFGCPVVDLYGEMGVNSYNYTYFLKEESWPVHMGVEGKKRMGKLVLEQIKKIEPFE